MFNSSVNKREKNKAVINTENEIQTSFTAELFVAINIQGNTENIRLKLF